MEEDERLEEITRYSPYRPPKEKYGEGVWVVKERHVEKKYPVWWQWVPKTDLDSPPEAPPDENLLTSAEKMARDWDRATSADGRPPIGGAPDD